MDTIIDIAKLAGMFSFLCIPIIIISLIISRIVKYVKKRNDIKFHSNLPDGFIEVRRNSIAVHPEKRKVFFNHGNKIYDISQIKNLYFDIETMQYFQESSPTQVKYAGDQDTWLVTTRDELVVETDDKTWRFGIKDDYEPTYEILRRLSLGRLTRKELEDIGFTV